MGEGEQEENTINHLKESEDEEEDDGRRVHQVRVLVLGVLLPLCDLCVDLGKAAVLVFDFPQKQDLESWRGFADHFHTNGGFGSSSLEIYLENLNIFRCLRRRLSAAQVVPRPRDCAALPRHEQVIWIR